MSLPWLLLVRRNFGENQLMLSMLEIEILLVDNYLHRQATYIWHQKLSQRTRLQSCKSQENLLPWAYEAIVQFEDEYDLISNVMT